MILTVTNPACLWLPIERDNESTVQPRASSIGVSALVGHAGTGGVREMMSHPLNVSYEAVKTINKDRHTF